MKKYILILLMLSSCIRKDSRTDICEYAADALKHQLRASMDTHPYIKVDSLVFNKNYNILIKCLDSNGTRP